MLLSAHDRVTSGLGGKQLSEPHRRPRFWVSAVSGCEQENCFDDKAFMRILTESISMYVLVHTYV